MQVNVLIKQETNTKKSKLLQKTTGRKLELPNYLRVIDGFNDHDIKFCMSVAERYLDNINDYNNKSKDPKKLIDYLRNKHKKDLI